MIPADMLSMVEGVAAKCAEGMQNGNGDPMSMMASMSGLFSMLNGGGGGGGPSASGSGKSKKHKLLE
jgi:hypothetical protein